MAKKTTAAERKAFIEEQRAKPQGYGARAVFPRDMSFIDREGNIVRPTRDNPFPTARGYSGKPTERKSHYDSTRTYGSHETSSRYHKHHNYTQELLAVVGLTGVLSGLFFLSPNLTGNAIANVSQSSSNALGAVLLVVGLVGAFFWAQKK